MLQCVHALRESLQDQHIIVHVYDQRRQQVAFRIDETVGVRVRRYPCAPECRRADSTAPPFAVNRLVTKR